MEMPDKNMKDGYLMLGALPNIAKIPVNGYNILIRTPIYV